MKFLLTLVAASAAGMGSLYAADVASPPPAAKPTTTAGAPVVMTGKIVVVDKVARTLTVEVDGKLQQFTVGPNVKMVNNGRLVTLSQLAAGQVIAVLSRMANGKLQLVALSVEPSSAAATAAGKGGTKGSNGKGKAKGKGKGKGGGNAPFTTLANPANNLGPIISPSE